MLINDQFDIPRAYLTGETKPANNVGELIELLRALPPTLKIHCGYSSRVAVNVTGVSSANELRANIEEVDWDP